VMGTVRVRNVDHETLFTTVLWLMMEMFTVFIVGLVSRALIRMRWY